MIINLTCCIEILRRQLDNRLSRNSNYSLRAFARDIGVSPSSLSDILNGKQGFSKNKAIQIGNKLGFNPMEINYFSTLAESKYARSLSNRKIAKLKLQKFLKTKETELSIESFKIISQWYHLAILELTKIESFESDNKWIAKKLGITIDEVRQAIERLIKMNLLEKKKEFLKLKKKLS